MIEVLAPAGGQDSFKAAVLSGADAVYFGAGNFNARRNAKNFSEEDIKQSVEFARVRGVKTYLTLNTLLADGELAEALKTALFAAECGIDALIVQDLGLIRALKTHLPNMPIHASTQMSVHSAESLRLIKEMGFSRVVVAREMDRESLKRLCLEAKGLGLEVEAFVHGALCMCLSGQCYLSSVLGGRSGNRGLCAQPCRLAFGAENGTGHDLSLKDMSYIPYITEMAEMGVASFKIEGRMKRPEYVAAAVTAVKSAAKGESVPQEVAELLSGLFSRSGHTDGYYTDSLGRNMFGVRTENDEKLSAKMQNRAHELYRREIGRVKLSGKVLISRNKPIELTLSDGDGHSVTVLGEKPSEAINRPVDEGFVTDKLKKSGGTPYLVEAVATEIGEGLSVSASGLNDMKRRAFELLNTERGKYNGEFAKDNTVAAFKCLREKPSNEIPKTVVQLRSVGQIPDELSGVSAVILPCETDFKELNLPEGIPVLADIPRGILHNGAGVLEQLKQAKQNGVKAAVCGNLAAFSLAKQAGLSAVAGFGMNIYNSESLKAVEALGAKASVLSFELTLSDAVRLSGNGPKGIIAYGRLPLMLMRNCPNKNGVGCAGCKGLSSLTDRKGVKFPLMCRGEFCEMLNSRPVWLFDRGAELKGLDFEVLMFTDETADRVKAVLEMHRKSLAPEVEFTRGLYYREVL